jgi:hypothetical protein
MSHPLIMQQLFIKFSSSVYSPTHILPALDQLGIVHTQKHNTQMRKTGINMIQNFTEFY